MTEYVFAVYCDICNRSEGPFETEDGADAFRDAHFDEYHEDNPMVTQNARIQRYPEGELDAR